MQIEAARTNRRVIFFCSCGSPYDARTCHRAKVAELLLRAAKKRKKEIAIEEWPGGMPAANDLQRLHVDLRELHKARSGAMNVQLTDAQASTELAGLPWGGFVELAAGDEKQVLSAGPLAYRAKRWQLPIFVFPVEKERTPAELLPDALRLRAKLKIDPLIS